MSVGMTVCLCVRVCVAGVRVTVWMSSQLFLTVYLYLCLLWCMYVWLSLCLSPCLLASFKLSVCGSMSVSLSAYLRFSVDIVFCIPPYVSLSCKQYTTALGFII